MYKTSEIERKSYVILEVIHDRLHTRNSDRPFFYETENHNSTTQSHHNLANIANNRETNELQTAANSIQQKSTILTHDSLKVDFSLFCENQLSPPGL